MVHNQSAMGGQGPSQDFLKQASMMASMSGKQEQFATAGAQLEGVIHSFKDLLSLRKHDPPFIEVREPTIKAGAASKHHVYKVCGRDHLGEIDVQRRFREFDQLRKVFYSRFLGLYVPPIPEKKAMVK